MMRVRTIVNSHFPGTSLNPGEMICTNRGERTIPVTVKRAMIRVKSKKKVLANFQSFSLDSSVFNWVNTGTKAAVIVPSPVSLLNKLGMI